jgi:hypothetical protein
MSIHRKRVARLDNLAAPPRIRCTTVSDTSGTALRRTSTGVAQLVSTRAHTRLTTRELQSPENKSVPSQCGVVSFIAKGSDGIRSGDALRVRENG